MEFKTSKLIRQYLVVAAAGLFFDFWVELVRRSDIAS